MRDGGEMKFRLATVPIGEEAQIEFVRKGKNQSITITAMAPPDSPSRETTILEGAHPLNGVTVSNINPAVAVELGLDYEENGVVVQDVRNSRAIRVVKPGDIIVSINNDDIDDVKDLERELDQGARQGAWALVFERGGVKRQIIIR